MTEYVILQEGWLMDFQGRLAHYFEGGHSACHLWASTTLDARALPGVPRCPYCVELKSRVVV